MRYIGEFPGVLKQRLNDSNKNLQIQALDIAGQIAAAMGKPFEKYLKPLTGPVTAALGDNKANVRAAGVSTLEHFRKECGLDGMIPSFGASLAADAPTLRKELLAWLAENFKEGSAVESVDLSPMVSPLLSCLQDRNAEVRKSAQACLPAVIASAGYEAVVNKAGDLKGAQRQAVMPIIEANRGAAAATTTAASAATNQPSAPSKQPGSMGAQSSENAAEDKPSSIGRTKVLRRKPGLQPPRPVSSGIASPAATSAPAAASSDQAQAPVLTKDGRAKQIRAKKEIRWQFDIPRSDIIDALRASCEGNINVEILNLLFSTSQYAERDRLNGLTLLDECLANPEISMSKYNVDFADLKLRYIANADLIFKYLTLRFFDTNTSMLIKCLDLTQHLVTVMDEESYHLTEYEAVSFLPYLINKVRSLYDCRFKSRSFWLTM